MEMLQIIERESQQVYDNFRDFVWTNDPNQRTAESLFMYLTDFNQQFFGQTEVQVEGQLFPENSELTQEIPAKVVRHVIPLFKDGVNIGQIDIDSNTVDPFSNADEEFLEFVNEEVAKIL